MQYTTFRFKPADVQQVIHEVLKEELDGKDYDEEQVAEWTENIGNKTKKRLKGKQIKITSEFMPKLFSNDDEVGLDVIGPPWLAESNSQMLVWRKNKVTNQFDDQSLPE